MEAGHKPSQWAVNSWTPDSHQLHRGWNLVHQSTYPSLLPTEVATTQLRVWGGEDIPSCLAVFLTSCKIFHDDSSSNSFVGFRLTVRNPPEGNDLDVVLLAKLQRADLEKSNIQPWLAQSKDRHRSLGSSVVFQLQFPHLPERILEHSAPKRTQPQLVQNSPLVAIPCQRRQDQPLQDPKMVSRGRLHLHLQIQELAPHPQAATAW